MSSSLKLPEPIKVSKQITNQLDELYRLVLSLKEK
jgi:hypothetical protein